MSPIPWETKGDNSLPWVRFCQLKTNSSFQLLLLFLVVKSIQTQAIIIGAAKFHLKSATVTS